MAYIPISDSPSAFLFGAGSVLLDFAGTYFHIDGGDEDLKFVRHVRKLSGLIVSAPNKNGLNSALQHNQSTAVPIVGHVPAPKSAPSPDSLEQLAHDVRAKARQNGMPITTPMFTTKYEPTLLSMSLCSGKVELFVLDGGKKEAMHSLERAMNSGDEAAIEKVADAHGLILVVVWYSAKLADPIKRILYTGNASTSRILAALEKAESLSLLGVRNVTTEQAAKGVVLPARVAPRPSMGSAARPAAARGVASAASRPPVRGAPPRPSTTSAAARPAARTATTGAARPTSTSTSRPSLGARVPAATTAPAKPPTSRTGAGPSGRLGSASSTSGTRGTAPVTSSPARHNNNSGPAQKRTVGTVQGASASRAAKPPAAPAKKAGGPSAPTTPGRPWAAASGHGAATTPRKAAAPATVAEAQPVPPTVVANSQAHESVLFVGSVPPPVIVLGDSEDEALPQSHSNVDVVVIPPTTEPPMLPENPTEPEAPSPDVAATRPEDEPVLPDAAVTEEARYEAEPAAEPVVATLPEPTGAADDSVMFVGEVPAPNDSVVFVGESGPDADTMPMAVPSAPATDTTAPFEDLAGSAPDRTDFTPAAEADDSVQVIEEVPPPVAPEATEPVAVEFKEPHVPQPVGDSGLLDDIKVPARLRKISMDTDDLDFNAPTEQAPIFTEDAAPSHQAESTVLTSAGQFQEEVLRKLSEQMFADAATPFTSDLASSISHKDEEPTNEHSMGQQSGVNSQISTSVEQLIDTLSDVTGPVQEAAGHEAATTEKHHTMQARSSLVSKQNGGEGTEERHMEYEQTDPAIDTVLDAVATDSEERDRDLDNGLQPTVHKENEKEGGEWKESKPFVSSNGPMMMTITRNGGKARLTRERYFELVTVPHKNGKCTLESLEEATDFFEGVRSSIYVVASDDLPMFVLEGCLVGKKAWKSAADMPCALIPTLPQPNLQSFAATHATELANAQLSLRPAISNSVMTINTDEGPEDYDLAKVTL